MTDLHDECNKRMPGVKEEKNIIWTANYDSHDSNNNDEDTVDGLRKRRRQIKHNTTKEN